MVGCYFENVETVGEVSNIYCFGHTGNGFLSFIVNNSTIFAIDAEVGALTVEVACYIESLNNWVGVNSN